LTLRAALDHVQVVAPPGGLDDAVRFYGEVIGLERIERPDSMGGVGAWFRVGSQELHLSEDESFVPAAKAHPAFEIGDLDRLAGRLEAIGAAVRWDERLPGARRFYAFDPAGNRLEFLSRT
jgi:catechol 2,3-dioxygenase-like lactoylglutathione lyase family enzyme